MPHSRGAFLFESKGEKTMPYIHFSDQEKQAANEADLVSYLHSVGESTEQHGRDHGWVHSGRSM